MATEMTWVLEDSPRMGSQIFDQEQELLRSHWGSFSAFLKTVNHPGVLTCIAIPSLSPLSLQLVARLLTSRGERGLKRDQRSCVEEPEVMGGSLEQIALPSNEMTDMQDSHPLRHRRGLFVRADSRFIEVLRCTQDFILITDTLVGISRPSGQSVQRDNAGRYRSRLSSAEQRGRGG